MEFKYIDIDLLRPEKYAYIKDVVISEWDRFTVRQKGLTQPIHAYPNTQSDQHEHYLMFAGLKVWLIAQEPEFQIPQVPVLIHQNREYSFEPTRQSEAVTLHDRPVDIIEEAKMLQRVLDDQDTLSIAELARQLGRKRSDLSNQLRLLKLPIEIRNWIKQEKLSPAAGRSLITLKDPLKQRALAKEVMKDTLSIRTLEQRVRAMNQVTNEKLSEPASPTKIADPNTAYIERSISQAFGATVTLSNGKMVIDYCDDLDILQGLLEKMGLVGANEHEI